MKNISARVAKSRQQGGGANSPAEKLSGIKHPLKKGIDYGY